MGICAYIEIVSEYTYSVCVYTISEKQMKAYDEKEERRRSVPKGSKALTAARKEAIALMGLCVFVAHYMSKLYR